MCRWADPTLSILTPGQQRKILLARERKGPYFLRQLMVMVFPSSLHAIALLYQICYSFITRPHPSLLAIWTPFRTGHRPPHWPRQDWLCAKRKGTREGGSDQLVPLAANAAFRQRRWLTACSYRLTEREREGGYLITMTPLIAALSTIKRPFLGFPIPHLATWHLRYTC